MRKRKFSEIHNKYKEEKLKEKHIKQLYNQIKEEYINDKNLDITLEKIYLQKEIDGYIGDTLKSYIDFISIFLTVLLTVIVERYLGENNNIFILIIGSMTLSILFIRVAIYVNKSRIKREIDEHIYYNVCLEVIKEIEDKNKALG